MPACAAGACRIGVSGRRRHAGARCCRQTTPPRRSSPAPPPPPPPRPRALPRCTHGATGGGGGCCSRCTLPWVRAHRWHDVTATAGARGRGGRWRRFPPPPLSACLAFAPSPLPARRGIGAGSCRRCFGRWGGGVGWRGVVPRRAAPRCAAHSAPVAAPGGPARLPRPTAALWRFGGGPRSFGSTTGGVVASVARPCGEAGVGPCGAPQTARLLPYPIPRCPSPASPSCMAGRAHEQKRGGRHRGLPPPPVAAAHPPLSARCGARGGGDGMPRPPLLLTSCVPPLSLCGHLRPPSPSLFGVERTTSRGWGVPAEAAARYRHQWPCTARGRHPPTPPIPRVESEGPTLSGSPPMSLRVLP